MDSIDDLLEGCNPIGPVGARWWVREPRHWQDGSGYFEECNAPAKPYHRMECETTAVSVEQREGVWVWVVEMKQIERMRNEY